MTIELTREVEQLARLLAFKAKSPGHESGAGASGRGPPPASASSRFRN